MKTHLGPFLKTHVIFKKNYVIKTHKIIKKKKTNTCITNKLISQIQLYKEI